MTHWAVPHLLNHNYLYALNLFFSPGLLVSLVFFAVLCFFLPLFSRSLSFCRSFISRPSWCIYFIWQSVTVTVSNCLCCCLYICYFMLYYLLVLCILCLIFLYFYDCVVFLFLWLYDCICFSLSLFNLAVSLSFSSFTRVSRMVSPGKLAPARGFFLLKESFSLPPRSHGGSGSGFLTLITH